MTSQIKYIAAALSLAATSAMAGGHLKEVTFGSNWVAQAEHGGFYQSVADGTYAECGLDVEIVSGGPQLRRATHRYPDVAPAAIRQSPPFLPATARGSGVMKAPMRTTCRSFQLKNSAGCLRQPVERQILVRRTILPPDL